MPCRRNFSKDTEMPKLKTKSGAKKRFGRTATGKVVRNWGHKRHRLISKAKQQKRLHRLSDRPRKGREGAALCLSRSPQQKARFPRVMDPAHQCRRARAWADLLAIHARRKARGDRHRPQGAVRPGDPR